MRNLSFAILIVFSGNLFSQSNIELSSIIKDRLTKQHISYANVGFIDRGLGTVTDQEGYFKLSFPEKRINEKDTLQITAQGYYPLRIAFSNLQTVLDKTKILYLSKLPDKKETVDSFDKDNIRKNRIGAVGDSKTTIGWNDKNMPGSEIATLVEIQSQKTLLQSLRFNIADHKSDSTKVRFNIYKRNTHNFPGSKLAQSKIYIIKEDHGEYELDLSSDKITVDDDIIVGIELLESYGQNKNTLRVNLSETSGVSFIKKTSQDSWQEVPFNTVGFQLDVLQSGEITNIPSKDNETKITGVVTTSGKPLQGCEVKVKGKLLYSYTDADGKFTIEAEEGDVLEFTSLVTEFRSILIKNEESIRASLEPRYDNLSEVIVKSEKNEDEYEFINTPFGLKKKRSLGHGAFSRDRDELNKFAPTFTSLIAGRFPGSRGSSSFLLSNNRVIIVDGSPFVGNTDVLDPNNIANVTVINGLAGTARYGTYGRNGVILVTTKTAMLNREFQLRKKKANSLLIKGNKYTELAQKYETTEDFKTSASNLKNSQSLEESKMIYLNEFESNTLNINFYIEAFDYFLKFDREYAYSILKTAEEIAFDNAKALRSLAFIYEENQQFELAQVLFKRIGELEPRRSQTYIDLAQNYVSIREYQKAFSLYKLILDNKIPGVEFGDSVMEIAVTEVKYLVTKHKNRVDYRDLHPSFYSKAQDLNGRILFEWNDPQSEFEIQFVNPQNKYYKWQHSIAAEPKELQIEGIQGYSMKEFVLDDKTRGTWLVNIKGFKNSKRDQRIPQLIKCTIYNNYGTPLEIRQIKLIELYKTVDKNTSIASINLE